MSGDLLRAIKRLHTPYHIVNSLLVFSYLPVREYILTDVAEFRQMDMFGITREHQILLTLFLYLSLKFRSSPTAEAFMGKFFLFSKVAILVLCMLSDYRVLAWYVVMFIVSFLTIQEKAYEGPNKVRSLRQFQFEEEVINDETNKYTLVEFYTVWADSCLQFTSLFNQLSLEYSSKHLSFMKVDIGLCPELAKRYNIDDSVTSKQLPTLILFYKGKPVDLHRLPPLKAEKGRITDNCRMTKPVIEEFFKLEEKCRGRKNL